MAPIDEEQLVRERLERLIREYPPRQTDSVEFLGAQFDAGLAFVHFPEGDGGLGVNRGLQALIVDSLQQLGAPSGTARNPIGYGMAAPTILTLGSEAQRR